MTTSTEKTWYVSNVQLYTADTILGLHTRGAGRITELSFPSMEAAQMVASALNQAHAVADGPETPTGPFFVTPRGWGLSMVAGALNEAHALDEG